MILQHVMALVNAGYTKAEIESMTNEYDLKTEEPKAEEPQTEEPKAEPQPETDKAKLGAFAIDYDKLSQSMLKAFQSANIRQNHQPQSQATDLSKFF